AAHAARVGGGDHGRRGRPFEHHRRAPPPHRWGQLTMGSYSGSSDWDDLPAPQSFAAFKPAAAPAAPPTPAAPAAEREAPLALAPGAVRKRLNAIFAFDTTGSMTPWIENVQQKLDYLAAGLLRLMDMEIAFIGVGDHGDGRNMLQISPLSRD